MNTLKLVVDNSREPVNEQISEHIAKLFTKLDIAQDCYIDKMHRVETALLKMQPEQLAVFETVLDKVLAC
jgi:hypothetical protein